MQRDLTEFWQAGPHDTLDALFAQAPVSMLATGPDHRILRVSRHLATQLGTDPETVAGRPLSDLLTEGCAAFATETVLPRLLKTGRMQDVELVCRAADGSEIPFKLSASAEYDTDGTFRQAIVFLSDNREVARIRSSLRAKVEEAREASLAKSHFLAAMSHEIRTPMNAIMGFAQLLKLSNLDRKRDGHVRAILQAGGALMNMLTDLLDLSQVEEGAMRIDARPAELRAMIDQISDWWFSSAEERGLRLVIETDPTLPEHVLTDPIRVQQVLNNFIGNAVKYTPAGRITLRVRAVAETPAGPVTRFEVEDTGIGMRPDQVEQLFKPFVQIETDFGKDRGGWGLGLSICANIAKAMGGEIGVDSEAGRGSTFWFQVTLPRATAPVDAQPWPAADTSGMGDLATPGMRVLLAEDNLTNQDMMRRLLRDMGHEVVTVSNGFEALEALMRDAFDLVLLDIMMPGLDGLETARQIRTAGTPVRAIPIVACSAHVGPEVQERYLKEGMSAFLPKPLEAAALAEVIREVTRPST